ncbi:hypothetical protein ECPV1252_51020 [Escherichia coli]
MDEVIFTYNEESALTAGQGSFITETGAHIINITEAELKQSEKGARFIEFSGESDDGRKIQISVFVFRRMTVLKINLGRALFTP